MAVDMPNSQPSRTKDFLSSPALSLTLAGIFRDAVGSKNTEVEEGSVGRRDDDYMNDPTVEISSENSGRTRSRSEDCFFLIEHEDEDENEDNGDDNNKNKRKKRKKYHRHTADQIRHMESLFKETPHPDEKQRQQLSQQLGLAPRQVKFWFQNRRTQIKAVQERHENSILKAEQEKLREENKGMRQTIATSCCPNCGSATVGRNSGPTAEEQHLRLENAKLKAEVEKLRAGNRRNSQGPASTDSYSASGNSEQENRSRSPEFNTGVFGLDKPRIAEIVARAIDELEKMAVAGEPLWFRSLETGRDILNYDEYLKECSRFSGGQNILPAGRMKRSIEASRETGIVFVDPHKLVQSFMDVNQWKEMFPSLISKAATIDVISHGDGFTRNGATQLMLAELQMPTPMVATREVYFVRSCKQLSPERWAILDVSIDGVEKNIDASVIKRPSGCIIEDRSNGHCKVTWVEHVECQKSTVHELYRTIFNSGLAFGAKRWMAMLQLQCERLVFFMATNVPTRDSIGVSTLAGRKSTLRLAQRMTSSFCHAISASSYHTWNKITSKTGEETRVSSRKNLNDPAEPLGMIVCAVSSVWLPVSPRVLFDFLRDESRRNEWDIMSSGGQAQSIVNLAKGQDRGNAVTIQATNSKEKSIWVLQDSYTNAFESMIVTAPVDITGMQSVITGHDSSNIPILPSGFSILPDGVEARSLVISSREEERNTEGGSLFTIALQILTSTSPAAKPTMESVESVSALISCTLHKIKRSLQIEES